MRTQSSLLCGAAAGALIALTMTTGAQARSRTARATAAPADSAEIKQLADQVDILMNRLNDETQARLQDEAQLAAARSEAAAAHAEATSAHAQLAEQIQTIPGQVQTAVAAVKPKASWADSTSVGGTVFADLTNIDQSPNPTPNSNNALNKDENGFNYDIKRFYLIVDHKFNDTFSANLTTDFTYDNATAAVGTPATTIVTGDKVSQLFVKKAYLQAKISDALVFRLGAAEMPWVPFVEGLYGYRYVENVLIDRTKFGTSTDWGVHVFGALPVNNALTVNYAVSAVNGMGYKTPGTGTANRSQGMDVEGRLSATLDKKLTVGVGGYDGKLGQDVQGITTYHDAERYNAVVAYVDPRFRIGGEYFWARAFSAGDILSSAAPSQSEGYSMFGSFNFTPKIALFGRYDWVKPKQNTASSFQDEYYNIGVSYEPVKTVDLALVYKRDSVDNGVFSTSNGSIGAGTGLTGTYDEFGLWTQYKW